MEAATPLRKEDVRVVGDALVVDGLTVTDETAVRVAREGDDAAQIVTDAIEIGARVLDREQAAANAEFVRAEFEKASKDVEAAFGDRAKEVAEFFGTKVDEVFGPEGGTLAKELDRHFADGSSTSVQQRVREIVAETMAKARADLVKQFSSGDADNPLADFKAQTVEVLRAATDRQDRTQRALLAQMAELQKDLQKLRDEKQRLEELEAERDKGTAKGRTFEEQLADALEEMAVAQGDCSEPVGDLKGSTRRTGDVVVSIGAADGPARGRIVFEAKNAKLSQPDARKELDRGMAERDADFAVLVVPGDDKVPARLQTLREYDGNKLVATLDAEDPAPLALQLAYRLARARVLMRRAEGDGIDTAGIQAVIERALLSLEEVRRVKSQLTGAKSSIDGAYEILEAMANQLKAQLGEIDGLVGGGAQAAASQGELEL